MLRVALATTHLPLAAVASAITIGSVLDTLRIVAAETLMPPRFARDLIAGFALVAYPAHWGESGVMTFIVNQWGKVYERNLGADSAEIAAAMTEFDPDTDWAVLPAP